MMSDSEKFVLFADMLGFSDLIKNHPLDLNDLRARSRPLSVENIDNLFGRFSGYFDPKETQSISSSNKLIKPENRLSKVFVDFHQAIKWILWAVKMQYSITAITFSDSLYIATQDLYVAIKIAVDLVHSLMRSGIPIRIGIAHGSFVSLNFNSDISLDGGEHSSQFLGTAVVRANETESCGIKGIRILLHQSILTQLENQINDQDNETRSSEIFKLIKCKEEEQKNKADIHYEINYWKFTTKRDAQGAWKGFQEMWGSAPKYALNHYLATVEAINRMRISNGESLIKRMRCKRLPKQLN